MDAAAGFAAQEFAEDIHPVSIFLENDSISTAAAKLHLSMTSDRKNKWPSVPPQCFRTASKSGKRDKQEQHSATLTAGIYEIQRSPHASGRCNGPGQVSPGRAPSIPGYLNARHTPEEV